MLYGANYTQKPLYAGLVRHCQYYPRLDSPYNICAIPPICKLLSSL